MCQLSRLAMLDVSVVLYLAMLDVSELELDV